MGEVKNRVERVLELDRLLRATAEASYEVLMGQACRSCGNSVVENCQWACAACGEIGGALRTREVQYVMKHVDGALDFMGVKVVFEHGYISITMLLLYDTDQVGMVLGSWQTDSTMLPVTSIAAERFLWTLHAEYRKKQGIENG